MSAALSPVALYRALNDRYEARRAEYDAIPQGASNLDRIAAAARMAETARILADVCEQFGLLEHVLRASVVASRDPMMEVAQ